MLDNINLGNKTLRNLSSKLYYSFFSSFLVEINTEVECGKFLILLHMKKELMLRELKI